jgi:hypothetical protein
MAREVSMTMAKEISFREKLYAEKEFVDVKILCNGKTFKCHKIVLSCQSEVFKTMIKNKSLTEKKTGIMKIEENDISSDVMDQLLYFLYHEKVKNAKMINTDLLLAADKYNIQGLLDECCKYFESKLSLQNALDILVLAETTNQNNLFETASRFVGKNLGNLEKSNAYQEMVNENPKMFTMVFSKMLEVKQAPKRGQPVQATGLNGVEFESSSQTSDDSSSDDE